MVDVLMLCVGSRGDVQPLACLAQKLIQQRLTVVVAAHGEYRSFVESFGCPFAEIRSSLPKALNMSETGQKLRDGDTNAAFTAGLDFFRPLVKDYLEDCVALTQLHAPRLLILTLFPYIAGGFYIKELLDKAYQQQQQQQQQHQSQQEQQQHQDRKADGQSGDMVVGGTASKGVAAAAAAGEVKAAPVPVPKLLIVHTVPAHPTTAFMPPTLGYSAPLGILNRLVWWLGQRFVRKVMYAPLAQEVFGPLGLPTDITFLEHEKMCKPQTLYCYSSAVLPKPRDWPDHVHVLGPWLPPGSYAFGQGDTNPRQHQEDQLPVGLLDYVNAARAAGRRVLYMGLGSMLGTMMKAEEATRVLQVMAEGSLLLHQNHPCCAVIHCSTDCSGGSASLPPAPTADAAGGPAPYMWLHTPVPHAVLLPLLDLVVHHGGMGTTHSTVAAGVPSLVVPAVLTADQYFWGAVLQAKGVGRVMKQQATKISAATLAQEMKGMMDQLEGFKTKARALAQKMQAEDGCAAAVDFIKGML